MQDVPASSAGRGEWSAQFQEPSFGSRDADVGEDAVPSSSLPKP